ncbi:hypothetical protein LIER_26253 [Lithospermum erythrorhizon]|uniref:Uncharacterized protein n=1 Tax=Lithospermum erythrorhizon TaxID=34254 RepID=A0AAV3RAX0_LITER
MLIKSREAKNHEAILRESFDNLRKFNLRLNLDNSELKPHVVAHPVEVIMDQPLLQILENPIRPRRIIKWAIDLSEFDVQYKPRTSIKAQALTDFMVELPVGRMRGYPS